MDLAVKNPNLNIIKFLIERPPDWDDVSEQDHQSYVDALSRRGKYTAEKEGNMDLIRFFESF
jgi:hypothetical protein